MKRLTFAVIVPLALGLAGAAFGQGMGTPRDSERQMEPDPYFVRVGGGIEGLAMTLDDRLATGPLWSATVGARPIPFMGVELGYSGSTHEVDSNFLPVGDAGAANGADLVRNGGSLITTLIAPTPIAQPYALVGVGVDRYTWRGDESNLAFRDDTAGRVPVGAGVHAASGAFDADLRFNYNVLFSQQFARISDADEIGATWDLGLQVGARF